MDRLDALPPDQRAVVALVLQQGRSYEDLAALLGIPLTAVRDRAVRGVTTLADGIAAGGREGEVADWLLGQGGEPPGLAADAEASAFAAAAAGPLGALPGVALPPLPDKGARVEESDPPAPAASAPPPAPAASSPPTTPADVEPAAAAVATAPTDPTESPAEPAAANGVPPSPDLPRARPRDARGEHPRRGLGFGRRGPAASSAAVGGPAPPASRLGGALLIALLAALVALGVFLVVRGTNEDTSPSAEATPTPTAAATEAQPQAVGTIPLRPANGSRARGQMTIFTQGNRVLFTIEGERLRPNTARNGYAVWFVKSGGDAQRLGYAAPVGEDRRLGLSGPPDDKAAEFPQLLSTYDQVVVSRETDDRAERPSRVVLRGRLPGAGS